MPGSESPYAVVYLLAALLPVGVALQLAARHRGAVSPLLWAGASVSRAVFVMLGAIALWAGGEAFGLMLHGEQATTWCARVSWLGIIATAPAVFLVVHGADRRQLSTGALAALWLIPAVTAAFVLGNDHNGFVWSVAGVRSVSGFTQIETAWGPWFWVHTAYSYVLLGWAFIATVCRYRASWDTHAKEGCIVVFAFVTPWVANLVYVLNRDGMLFDPTPLGFAVTGSALAWVVHRDALQETLPIALRTVLDTLRDGVLVVDEDGVLLDANPAAQALLGIGPSLEPSDELWTGVRSLLESGSRHAEFSVAHDRGEHLLEARVTAVPDELASRGIRVVTVRDQTDRIEARDRIQFLSDHDALTGLPNRARLANDLQNAVHASRWRGRVGSLLHFDLNRFGAINDSIGTRAGDEILRWVGMALHEGLAKPEMLALLVPDSPRPQVARIGSDEFGILLPGLLTEEDASAAAVRLLAAISRPQTLGDTPVRVSASVGIVMFPRDGDRAEELLRNADVARRHAKESGDNDYRYFRPHLNDAAKRRFQLENDLRTAFERSELALAFQPKVDLRSGAIVGTEALVRWKHPELGPVAPDEFVGVAERTGLILPLGDWVLDRACAAQREWRDAGLTNVPIAINCSGRQIIVGGLANSLDAAIRRHDLTPDDLLIEVTESSLLPDTPEIEATLSEISALGVGIHLDDFGTGYAALSYLTRFRFDGLKLDRYLVRNVDTEVRAIGVVASIVSLAHTLGYSVVAEGVERIEQARALQQADCDEAQGYLYSPPLPADACLELMQSDAPFAEKVNVSDD